MTQFVLGHFRCVVFDVGYFTISAPTLLANATEADRAAVMDRYDHDAEGIIFRIKPLLVETGQHRVLIDPGTGDDPGLLLQALKAEGIDPASVTTVIITHAHPDHYSGSVSPAGGPAFPRHATSCSGRNGSIGRLAATRRTLSSTSARCCCRSGTVSHCWTATARSCQGSPP